MFVHQSLVGRIVSQVLVLIAIAALLVPLGLIVAQSLRGDGFGNYVIVVSTTPFLRFGINSLIVAGTTVLLVLILSITAAYAFALLRPRGSVFGTVVVLAGLSLPGVALIVPLFSVVQGLGLLNTYWAVIVPLCALAIPFGVLVASNFIRSLPVEIYEAGRLDGANDIQFFWHILLPMCRPILAVVAIFTFLGAWNEYLLPLIFIQSTDMQVLTQVPTYFQSERGVDLAKIFAANILISLPVVAAYIGLQRVFRAGLTAGAIK